MRPRRKKQFEQNSIKWTYWSNIFPSADISKTPVVRALAIHREIQMGLQLRQASRAAQKVRKKLASQIYSVNILNMLRKFGGAPS